MADAVGLVPVLGRELVVSEMFRGRPVFWSAVDALQRAGARSVLVLATAEQAPSVAGELRGQPAVELVEWPAGERNLREVLGDDDIAVVHDPLCPLLPASSLRYAVESWERGTASVAVLDLVDTVKATRSAMVRTTLDRATLRVVSSPIVAPGAVLKDLADLGAILGRPAALVAQLGERCPVRLVSASPLSMRVEDASSLRVLASYGAVASGEGEA
jgi:2-C-methyl-D-erythritol 4-phosphate cytidylyltransferase